MNSIIVNPVFWEKKLEHAKETTDLISRLESLCPGLEPERKPQRARKGNIIAIDFNHRRR